MSTGKFILGTIVGITIGGIVGVLFAPASGVRTRRRILSKGEEMADLMKDKVNEYVDKAKGEYEDFLKDTDSLVHDGKVKYDEVAKGFKSLVS